MDNIKSNNSSLISIILLTLLFGFCLNTFGQISVPKTDKELSDYERERKIKAFLGIDLSLSKTFQIIDNKPTDNFIRISEVYYNEAGVPKKIISFDSTNNVDAFYIINYYVDNLPMELIKFSKDSVMISGSMFEYTENQLLARQINYNNSAKLTSESIYFCSGEELIVKHFDKDKEPLGTDVYTYKKDSKNKEIDNLVKKDKEGNIFESVELEYNESNLISKRNIVSDSKGNIEITYEYNSEGALIKSILNNNEITLYEYDDYGNLIIIIDKDKSDNLNTYVKIEYFSMSVLR